MIQLEEEDLMDTKVERFFEFIKKDKTKNSLAFAFYILFIITISIDLPLILGFICSTSAIIVAILGCFIYMIDFIEKKVFEQREEKMVERIKIEVKKIIKEIVMFIPVLLISIYTISFLMVGEPINESNINESFYHAPILNSIFIIIIGPIIEEYIFRVLPYKFIKNKIAYMVVSTVVFAAMHVVSDTNPFNYIWFYMIRPFYYSYRYQKTEDIWVTISLHSFSNLIATVPMMVS